MLSYEVLMSGIEKMLSDGHAITISDIVEDSKITVRMSRDLEEITNEIDTAELCFCTATDIEGSFVVREGEVSEYSPEFKKYFVVLP